MLAFAHFIFSCMPLFDFPIHPFAASVCIRYLWAIMLYACLFPFRPYTGDLFYLALGSNFTRWSTQDHLLPNTFQLQSIDLDLATATAQNKPSWRMMMREQGSGQLLPLIPTRSQQEEHALN